MGVCTDNDVHRGHGVRRKQSTAGCLLTSQSAPWHTCVHTCTYMNSYTQVKCNKNKIKCNKNLKLKMHYGERKRKNLTRGKNWHYLSQGYSQYDILIMGLCSLPFQYPQPHEKSIGKKKSLRSKVIKTSRAKGTIASKRNQRMSVAVNSWGATAERRQEEIQRYGREFTTGSLAIASTSRWCAGNSVHTSALLSNVAAVHCCLSCTLQGSS